MSKMAIEQVVGRLVIDTAFRRDLAANPMNTLAAFDLTAEERDALTNMDIAEFQDAERMVDERVSKLCICDF